jgi:hypothetical protein
MLLILSVALGVAGAVLMVTGDPLHAIGGFLLLGMAVVALVGSLIEQALDRQTTAHGLAADNIISALLTPPPEPEGEDR